MEPYALEVAKKLKEKTKAAKNGLNFFIAEITKQEPITITALSGNLIYTEGSNLYLSEDLKKTIKADSTKKEYIGRKVALIGTENMTALMFIAE